MHPLIKILCFIAFAAFVSAGFVEMILSGFGLLLAVWVVTKTFPDGKSFGMLRRMKIFFISISIIYIWFTPGELIFPVLDEWSPTYEGFILALLRISALCVLVLGVTTLLKLTPKEELICGLYYFSYPFSMLGLNRKKLIARIILTFDIASSAAPRENNKIREKLSIPNYIDSMVDRFVQKIVGAIDVKNPPKELVVVISPPPSYKEWFVFLSLITFFTVISQSFPV